MVQRRPSARYQLLVSVISLLMVLVLIQSLARFWNMRIPDLRALALAAGAVAYGWGWWRSRWVGGLMTGIGIGLLVLALGTPEGSFFARRVGFEARELVANLRALHFDATFGERLGQVLLALTAVASGVLISLEALLRGKSFWALVGGSLVFGTQWSWFFDESASYFMGYITLGLLLWVAAQAARRDSQWALENRKIGYPSHIATPVIVVLVASLAATMLPNHFEPVHLGEMAERLQRAVPVLTQLRGGGAGGLGGRFSLASTGFSPAGGTLGGAVQLNEALALELAADRPLAQTAYLRGATYLAYTGTRWDPGESPDLTIPESGTLPSTYAGSVPIDQTSIRLTPAITFNKTVFNLLEPRRVSDLTGGYTADLERNLWADKAIPKGTSYQVDAEIPRYSEEQIRKMGSQSDAGDLERYLQLPPELPERVRSLGRSVVQGYEHPLDKALAVEAFLRRFPYHLNANAPPKGQDFVDFFLFDEQRGYCTYYATAMVVLLRDSGIPSRLVEGFAVPPSAATGKDADGRPVYEVLNSQAHAWVEVFFPGYGWVTFDPTPRADLPLIDRSTPAPVTSTTPSTPVTNPSTDSPDRPQIPEEDPMDEDFGGGGGSTTPKGQSWPWYLTPLAALALLLLAVARHLSKQNRLVATEPTGQVQEAWEKTTGLLDRFDYGRAPDLTPREYAVQMAKTFPSLAEPMQRAAEDYTRARYGPGADPEDGPAAERARKLWAAIRQALFDRFGWRSYLWRRLRRRRRSKVVGR